MVKLQLAVHDGDSSELWEIVQRDLAAERGITVARPDAKPPRGTLGLTGAELTVDVATLAAIAKLARFLYDWIGARAKTKVELRDNKSGVSVILSREMTHEEALMPAPLSTAPLSELEAMIRDHYRLPDDVWGFLDWVTGLVRVNLTSEQFSGSERTQQFELTLNHELFHAFQICTTGYMYRVCMELLREIVRIIISAGEKLDLDRLIRTPPPSSSTLDALLTEIDRVNSDGITARDLIEGYAYYGHEALHNPALDAPSYARRLAAAPSRAYTNAFSYSEQRTDAETFELFPLLCYLALLFRDPPSVFCRLHDLLPRRCGLTAGKRRREVVKLLDQIPAEYLGIPCQDRTLYTAPNPFYSWSMQKISNSIGSSLLDYAAEPGTIPHDLQEALLRPIILNDLHQIEPHTFHVDSPYSLNATLITAFTSFRILSDHPQGPQMLSFRRNC